VTRFKVDENLPAEVAALLNAHGHDALTVRQQELAGATDARL
jgi:predicted nuclease of predicted toxin-antitoxin system